MARCYHLWLNRLAMVGVMLISLSLIWQTKTPCDIFKRRVQIRGSPTYLYANLISPTLCQRTTRGSSNMVWIVTFFLLHRMLNTGFNTTLWDSDKSFNGGLKLRLLRLVFIRAWILTTPYIYFGSALWQLFNVIFTYFHFGAIRMKKILGRKFCPHLLYDFSGYNPMDLAFY